jgi:glycine cleavage system transcriptional repressor
MRENTEGSVHFAVTIMGKDKPGIVAGAAEVLFQLGCNIEDSSCTILGGEFAMILIVSHLKPLSKAKLLKDFKSFGESMSLSVFVRSLSSDEVHYHAPVGELCMVSVYGSDRPGIVLRVTKELAQRNININDLNTKLVGTPDQPVYVMMLEAALPDGVEIEEVEKILEKLKKELDIEISVRPVTPVSL